tara:strand:+ start:39 stop:425 length:387 start_codon:yes stop_codon:yes gene_type:complete
MRTKALVRFVLILASILLVVFFVHISTLHFLNLDLFANRIITSYVGNFAFTVSIFAYIYQNKEKKTESLGFLFLGGSMVKFLLFFIFLNPFFMQDGLVSRVEFFSFFIPYVVALVVETEQLIKELNRV